MPKVNDSTFIDIFNSYIENKRNMIIVGDTNINILNNSLVTKKYVDSVLSNGFVLLNEINSIAATRTATRRRNNQVSASRTIIDHVLTDCTRYSFKISQQSTPLSDHNEILVSFDNHKSNNFLSSNATLQSTKLNYRNYNEEVEQFLATPINTFTELINGLELCKNNNTQNVIVTRKINPKKPWISSELLTLIGERDRYFKLRKKSPTNEYLYRKFLSLSNLIKQKKYQARTTYNTQIISQSMNSPKLMWSSLSSIIFNKQKGNSSLPAINTVDGLTTEKKLIANTLNDFFKNTGKTLFDQIPSTVDTISANFQPVPNSIRLFATTPEEILNKIYRGSGG